MSNLLQENKDLGSFHLSLDNFEGPIDLLLVLARTQKVDLSDISISALCDQYIGFINKYSDIHIEIAADYLVMAAWLTYLKSRLLLPKEEKTEEYTTEDLEKALKYQLQRLETFQKISKILYSRPIINRDIFYGGSSEGLKVRYNINYTSNLFDLLKSYSQILKSKEQIKNLTIEYSELYSVDQAIKRMREIFGSILEWTNFLSIIPNLLKHKKVINKSIISSNFVASLELSKNGFIEVKQEKTFGNIYIKLKN
ncbi:MAG: hypothetical protein CBD97_02915 [Pelagibacteraceae bacterium TMED237]|nr:MAG: hypothetical protein CBD97_02915 [Pelagibacteraceae bacterium TMED237]|tara:strand:- start:822 stop:1583 length:762 start_codon:yes stop_codon:yes gene_type:complete